MHVLHAVDGKPHWRVETQDAVRSSPVLCPDSGRIIFGSHDGRIYAARVGEKVVDAVVQPHQLVNQHENNAGAAASLPQGQQEPNRCLGPIFGSVVVSPQRWYAATLYGWILCLRVPSATGGGAIQFSWAFKAPKPIFATPALAQRGGGISQLSSSGISTASSFPILWAACVDGHLYALDSGNGQLLFTVPTAEALFSPPVAISLPTKREEDTHDVPKKPRLQLETENEVNTMKAIVFGSNDRHAYICAASDGTLLAKSPSLSASVVASPLQLSPDAVLVACTDGELVLWQPRLGNATNPRLRLPAPVFSTPVPCGPSHRPLSSLQSSDSESQAFRTRVLVGCRDDHLYALDIVLH